MVQTVTATYVRDGANWKVRVAGLGRTLDGEAPGIVAARDRADQLVDELAPEDTQPTVVHLLDGSAVAFTSAYMEARLNSSENARPQNTADGESDPESGAESGAESDAEAAAETTAESPTETAAEAEPTRTGPTETRPEPTHPAEGRAGEGDTTRTVEAHDHTAEDGTARSEAAHTQTTERDARTADAAEDSTVNDAAKHPAVAGTATGDLEDEDTGAGTTASGHAGNSVSEDAETTMRVSSHAVPRKELHRPPHATPATAADRDYVSAAG